MSQFRFTARFMVALLALFLIASQGVKADEVYGKIRGVVTDKTGATLPGVKVTAVNINTGLTREAVTNNDGSYVFDNLPTGQYKVTAAGKGFKTYLANNIPVILNRVYALNIPMELGEVNETVNVEANPVQVETTNSQLGTVISGNTIVDMPLNGRNWVQLQQTIPGVVASSDRFSSNFATNGAQSQQNSYLINGTDANDLPLNTPLIIPSPDAIGEFNLVTNTINPEYGRNSGAILNALIKSGTNAFHGSGFEFYRDTFLNSADYFTNKPAVFHQNQFGGTIGGPIVKDHTFFFFSYQGTRNRRPEDVGDTASGTPGNSTVFSPEQRAGFFDGIQNSSASSPFPLIGEDGAVHPAGTPYATLFPTGHIPAANFNPISLNLMNTYVPLPNAESNSFVFSPTVKTTNDQEIVRIDQNLSKNNQLWGSAFFQRQPLVQTLPFTGADLPGFGSQSQSHQKQFTIGFNHIFSATTLNEFRLGYTRLNFLAVQPQKVVQPADVGFTGITPQNPAGAGVPTIALNGYFTLGFTDNGPQPRIDQTYQLTDNFSHLVGKHALKFGFEGRRFQVNNPFFAVNNGHFDFNGAGPFSTGDPGADFLLGIPDDYSQGSGGFIDARANEYYMYFQDQWKLRPNFTVTWGAGYQIDTPLEQRFNNGLAVNCFRPGEQSTVFPTSPVGIVFPGDPGCNSAGGATTRYGHIGPRLGFAWDITNDGKTSLRGGYGIYYNRSEEELTLQTLGTPPFGLTSFGAGQVTGGVPTFANPFVDIAGKGAAPNPFPFAPPAPGSPVDFSIYEPFSISVIDPNFSTPYAMNYNLTLQRELPSQVVFSLGYVGSVGRRLIRAVEQNPALNPTGCLTQTAVDPTTGETIACADSGSNQYSAFPENFRYPGNIYGSIGAQTTTGTSSYNSLQVSARKNLTHGITFLASYTWSHSLDDGSGFENSGFGGSRGRGVNPFDRHLDWSDSSFDARHRAVFSYTYNFPFPRNAFLNRIVGGFRIAGITSFQSGFPFGIRDTGFTSLTCTAISFYACWDSPDQVVANIKTLDPRTSSFGTKSNYWFDPSSFAPAALGTLGNARRNPLHGPGINNTDLALFKDIKVNERSRFELRLEGFNVFNHTQFLQPNNNVASSNFGRITSARAPRQVQLGAKFYF